MFLATSWIDYYGWWNALIWGEKKSYFFCVSILTAFIIFQFNGAGPGFEPTIKVYCSVLKRQPSLLNLYFGRDCQLILADSINDGIS